MSKPCKYCPLAIWWSQEDDRWIPYEDEARTIVHDCPNKDQSMAPAPSQETARKPLKAPPLTDEEINYLRKMIRYFKVQAPK